jgi:hypothetical protein
MVIIDLLQIFSEHLLNFINVTSMSTLWELMKLDSVLHTDCLPPTVLCSKPDVSSNDS